MTVKQMLALNEAVLDAPADGGGEFTPAAEQPEPDAPEGEQPEPETAPELPAAANWDDPALQELIDQRAAEIARAQIEQHTPPAAQAVAEPDLNELLDPLSDNFGRNLGNFIRQQLAEGMAPLTQITQAQQQTENQTRLEAMRDSEVERAGGFPEPIADKAKSLVLKLAPAFAEEAVKTHGNTSRADQAMLAKAAQTVRDLLAEAGKSGGQAAIDNLAAVAGATGSLPGSGSAMNVPPPAKSLAELHQRRFGVPV